MRFYGLIMFWNEFRIIKPQNLGSLLMKSSQSNFNLQSPSSYLARKYLIATVCMSQDSSVSLSVQPTQPLYGLRARHTTKEITLLRRIYSNDSAISLHHVPKDI